MAEDAGPAAGDNSVKSAAGPNGEDSTEAKKQRSGFLSRLKGFFGGRNEDFEKKLRYLSKEETTVHARLKRRGQSSRKAARNIVVLSVILEVAAVAYAIMTTRSLDMNWKMRAVRVLPMFLLPAISSVIYTILVSFTRMFDQKDQKTLERLRAERKAKIDELKERTNYYTTQQLIQRYDLDPAAKAAAATVLASKLGADSGLKVYLGDESNTNSASERSSDVELVQTGGLRNRKPSHSRSHSTGNSAMATLVEEAADEYGADAPKQSFVEHHRATGPSDGGWIARIAALLVGEDPTQSYALICGNCHMHNGLARKEDFTYITYYCPHCNALNRSRQSNEFESVSNSSGKETPTAPGDGIASSQNASRTTSLESVQELSVEENNEQEISAETN